MPDKKSAETLIRMLDKYSFSAEEKLAIRAAIGILGWASLNESRIKVKKDKLAKSSK